MDATNTNENISLLTVILKLIANLGGFTVRFILYLINLTLNLLSNLIEKIFLENWNWYIKRYEEETEKLYEIQVVSNGTKHEYIMTRGKEYDKLYKDLKSNIDVMERGNNLVLDLETSKDIIAKLDRIIFLVERNALKEGYKFGKASKKSIEDEDVYSEYIIDQVKKGR